MILENKEEKQWFDQLENIPEEFLQEYCEEFCDMVKKENVPQELEDYSDWELVDELELRDYDFSDKISEEEMIDYLEDSGYYVKEEDEEFDSEGLDIVDEKRLAEIIEKFKNGSWSEREDLFLRVCNYGK